MKAETITALLASAKEKACPLRFGESPAGRCLADGCAYWRHNKFSHEMRDGSRMEWAEGWCGAAGPCGQECDRREEAG